MPGAGIGMSEDTNPFALAGDATPIVYVATAAGFTTAGDPGAAHVYSSG